jgi:2-oxoisovalerate dehydrogenase E1 component
VLENVRQTGKVLIVHEDTLTNGFAGEICAVVASQAFTDLDAPVERIGVPDIPIPYNIRMMNAIVPSVASIRATMERLLAFYTLPAWNDFFHARSTEIFAFDCSLQQNQKAIKAC